jgi:hypothetical protein
METQQEIQADFIPIRFDSEPPKPLPRLGLPLKPFYRLFGKRQQGYPPDMD